MTPSPVHVTLLRPEPHQRSSFAIAEETLDTANRVARMQGRATVFAVEVAVPPAMPVDTDLVVLPGLGLATEGEVSRSMDTQGFTDLVRALEAAPEQAVIAGACSACFALGAAGLLDGREVTTTWWLAPALAKRVPRAKLRQGDLVVEDGRLITAGAAFSQIDLMLHLIERFASFGIAEDCRRFLMADQRSSQLPYVSVATLVAGDPALQRAELFLRQQIGTPVTVAELAAAAGLGQRSFARRLQKVAAMTPSTFVQTLRMSTAIRLARNTTLSQEEIAHRVGYSDATALRRVMRKLGGGSLDQHRR